MSLIDISTLQHDGTLTQTEYASLIGAAPHATRREELLAVGELLAHNGLAPHDINSKILQISCTEMHVVLEGWKAAHALERFAATIAAYPEL